jgi:undecaprenyl-diphosphatase
VLRSLSQDFLSLSGTVALVLVFVLPALESSAFLGFVFPGETAVLLGGVLAYNHHVSLTAVLIAASAGAILGDTVGYEVGRHWGERILRWIGRRLPFVRHRIDDHIGNATEYVRRRGASAVFFGRFTTGLRVMVPGLAGMAGVPYPKFLVFNAAGGIAWSTTFVLLGYFAGAAWERVAGYASKAGLGLLVLILVVLVIGRRLRRVRATGRSVPDHLAATRAAAWFRARYPRTSAWLARRVDTATPTGFRLTFVVVVGATCWWVFGALTEDVVAHNDAVLTDPDVTRFLVEHRVAWLTSAMLRLTWLGSSAVLVPLVVLVGWLLLARFRRGDALLLVASLAGAQVLYDLVKVLVDRPRPPAVYQLVRVGPLSFPSGHAAAATAVWFALALIGSRGRSTRVRIAMWVGAALIVAIVCFSRVYLGVHWWTDVAAGAALGGGLLCAALVVRLWIESRRPIRPDAGGPASPGTTAQPARAASG